MAAPRFEPATNFDRPGRDASLDLDLDPLSASTPEDQPFLHSQDSNPSFELESSPPAPEEWTPPRGFIYVQLAIMANVFLYGFDGTVTAAAYAVIGSEFGAANTASWLTTAYLVAATACQPLYGRLSDVFGRRACFFTATTAFAIGCLGCGVAGDVVLLDCMRALTGLGGGGLMTMATIVNSDMIPFRRRGMYQAMQNGMFGFGAVCGASLGGSIADTIGWRWCFLLQVPISVFAFVVGARVIKDPSSSSSHSSTTPRTEQELEPELDPEQGQEPGHRGSKRMTSSSSKTIWAKVDLSGAFLLVIAVSLQLVGLSLGGNELPWGSPWVIGSLAASIVLLALFLLVEARTTAMPIIPLRMLRGRLPVLTQIANVCAGLSAYAYLFNLPLFFQVVLLDSATAAGARLAIPSLATPLGGLVAGVIMSRWGRLAMLVRLGALLMVVGNALVASLAFDAHAGWRHFVYIFPANLGQGIIYPAILFTSLATFEHADHAVSASTVYLIRSLGTVWGVAATSAIVQTTLSVRLPDALGEIPDKWTIVEQIRHSVSALRDLPPDIQLTARRVYYEGLRYSFAASTGAALVSVCAAMMIRAEGLRSTN